MMVVLLGQPGVVVRACRREQRVVPLRPRRKIATIDVAVVPSVDTGAVKTGAVFLKKMVPADPVLAMIDRLHHERIVVLKG